MLIIGHLLYAATKASKLKRKRPIESIPPSHSKKVLKVTGGDAKLAASKQGIKRTTSRKSQKTKNPFPRSDGCARASVNGWEWHRWSVNASPAERAHVRGIKYIDTKRLISDVNKSHLSSGKVLSARTNRAKLRNLVAAAEGADLLKATQLKVIRSLLLFLFLFLFICGVLCLNIITGVMFLVGKEKTIAFPKKQDT